MSGRTPITGRALTILACICGGVLLGAGGGLLVGLLMGVGLWFILTGLRAYR